MWKVDTGRAKMGILPKYDGSPSKSTSLTSHVKCEDF